MLGGAVDHRLQRGIDHVATHGHPAHADTLDAQQHIGGGTGLGAGGESMLGVVEHVDVHAGVALPAVNQGRDGPLPLTAQLQGARRGLQLQAQALLAVVAELEAAHPVAVGGRQIVALEQGADLLRADLAAARLRLGLDPAAEVNLQPARQLQAEIPLQQIGHPSLAGLAVDADHRLVATAEIGRIDGQVSHVPVVVRFVSSQGLADGILVAAGKRGVDQLAGIGMARVQGNLGAGPHGGDDGVHVGQVELGIDPLAVEVHGHGDDVHVAGALPVAEQGALDAIRSRQHRQLGGCHPAAPIVVGVDGDAHLGARLQVAAEPLHLIRKHVGGAHLHRSGQVQDHGASSRAPLVDDGVTYLDGKLHLGAAEALRRILEAPLGARVAGRVLPHPARPLHGDSLDPVLAWVEHIVALGRVDRVVDVDDGPLRPLEGLESSGDEIFPGLHQHLDGNVIGDEVALDELPHEVEVGLGGRREAHLDVLEADMGHQRPHLQLLGHRHGLDQRLVAVAQVHGAPERRPLQHPVGPLAIRQIDHGGTAVFAMIEAHILIPLADMRGAGRPGRQAGGARRGSGLAR